MADDNVRNFARGKRGQRAAGQASPLPDEPPPSASAVPPPNPGADAAFELWLARHARNDLGNARRLIARRGHDLTWVKAISWHTWDGKRWNADDGDELALISAQAAADAMFGEAAAEELAGRWHGETDASFADRIAAARKWASGSSNFGRITAMLGHAKPLLRRRTADLDADPYLFNVANGTLELGRLEADGSVDIRIREHRRADFITRVSPIAYDPEATECPLWRESLNRFLPDRDVQLHLQRWYGYCLSGSIEEQCVILQHGEGNNFKSTMVAIICYIMGDYAVPIPIASLLARSNVRGSEPSPDIARLPGARLVCAAEPRRGAPLDESLIKNMTGGEQLTARHLNRGFIDFKPTFKLVISFNRRPTIVGDDDGIWRRLRLVPFEVQIPDAEVQKEYVEKLKPEGPAILNWALDGYRMWRESGLATPEAVRRATASYRMESDKIGPFLASACIITGKDAQSESAADLWHAYVVWCRRNGARAENQTWLGRRLVERKGIRREVPHNVVYFGIEIVDRSLLDAPLGQEPEHDEKSE